MMRLADAVGEALRNLRTGAAGGGILALILVVASTMLLLADIASIGALQERALSVRNHAGDVRVLIAKDAVDPRACAALESLDGVTDAGAIWTLGSVQLIALPRVNVPVFEVSSGVARMLHLPSSRPGGVYLSDDLAARWSAREESILATTTGPVMVRGTFRFPDDGRDPRFTNAVIVIGDNSARSSECWFSVWPATSSVDPLAYGAVAAVGQTDAAPQVAPLNPTVGQLFAFAQDYRDRLTAFAAPTVIILFALVGFGGSYRRRLELASNLHAGARHRDLVRIAAIEAFLWASAAAAATFVVARLATRVFLYEDVPGLLPSLAVTQAVAVCAAMCAATIPALLARESRLFTLFKSRT
ncbi:hypothetical protein [Microbacterium sp. NPDC086615]|uniref:hypothetical protein n=1 Tax=Microbacterium sp. NPDC086615 TaxID=3154865 RepID=UPI00343F7984|nr:hypothetical protein [Microbacterium sp.]